MVTIRDNPIAVSICQEIAQEHGFKDSFEDVCPEISTEKAKRIVNNLRDDLDDFLQHYTTRASRLAEKHAIASWGSYSGTLTRRPLFDSYDEFYQNYTGLSGDDLLQFLNVVNKGSLND